MTQPITSTPERRRSERFETPSLDATCAGAALEVRNLSLHGLSFETESRLTPGSLVGIKLASDAGELRTKGRVMWCRMVASVTSGDGAVRPRYRGGLHFEELSEQDGAVLVELVGRLWKKDR